MTKQVVQVIATKDGFYEGKTVKAGTEFGYDVSTLPEGEDGKPVKPSWVVPATAKNRATYSPLPTSHGKLDLEGRPYPYSVPGVPPGTPGASMDVIAKAVNDANDKANAEVADEAAKVEAAKVEKAKGVEAEKEA